MKTILFAVALFTTINCSAQDLQNIKKFVFLGVQGNDVRYSIDAAKQNTSYKIGGQAGIGFKIPFEGRLSFVPMGYYSLKGYKVKFDRSSPFPDPGAINNSTTIHCFELAATLQHDFKTDAGHVFFRIGPSLDFQLFGNEKFDKSNNTTVDQKMKFGYAYYGNFSANALIHFGYETASGFFIYGQFSGGLANICNYDGGPDIRHRNAGISAGFYLKKK